MNGNPKQAIPFALKENDAWNINIFVDRSIIEKFVNSWVYLVQRGYPLRDASTQFRLFSEDGMFQFSERVKWKMDAIHLH
jgi:sucrose-6-phosphate hydrolase SacC (GH32 family)